MEKQKGSELFIVDNSDRDWEVLQYLHDWCQLSDKIDKIMQLRPLVSNQPWGIFFNKFEPKKLPIVVLLRILGKLVKKKRASVNSAGQTKGGKHPRVGRVLTDEDIDHYQKIIVALSETIRIMQEIDDVIDQHGGWPGAFITDRTQTDG